MPMQRSLLPNVLASLGLFLIFLVSVMPLFEWKINKEVADFPPTYDVYFSPSPWATKLGESLDSKSYIFRQQVLVSENHNFCINEKDFNLSVARLSSEKALESISLYLHKNISWLELCSFGIIIFSGIYIWWITIWIDHRPISEAITSTIISIILFALLIATLMIVQPLLARDYFMVSDNCIGTLKLSASLLKIHYETLIVIIAGISAELGAFIIMLQKIGKVIDQRKKSSMPAAG
jgi:hypothetical protein